MSPAVHAVSAKPSFRIPPLICSFPSYPCPGLQVERPHLPHWATAAHAPKRFQIVEFSCHSTTHRHFTNPASVQNLTVTKQSSQNSPPLVEFCPSNTYSVPLPRKPRRDDNFISENEYRARMGRALQLLRATLPDFMRIGLVDYDNHQPFSSDFSNHPIGIPFPFSSLWKLNKEEDTYMFPGEDGSIYHPRIAFRLRPMVRSHVTDGQEDGDVPPIATRVPSIGFSGRPLYFTSANVLRHALMALFSDTSVTVERLTLVRSGGGHGSSEGAPNHGLTEEQGLSENPEANQYLKYSNLSSLADELVVRVRFEGVNRVTGQPHDYTIVNRYAFDRGSGTIVRHVIESIQPAPGNKLWEGLSSTWLRLAGVGPLAPSHSQ